MKKKRAVDMRIKYIFSSVNPFMISKALGIIKAPYNAEDLELCNGVYFYTVHMGVDMLGKDWEIFILQLAVEVQHLQKFVDVEAEILSSVVYKSA